MQTCHKKLVKMTQFPGFNDNDRKFSLNIAKLSGITK